MRKFKRGDKVIINSKSLWCHLENSKIYNRGKDQGYWYFIDYEKQEKIVCIISNILNLDKSLIYPAVIFIMKITK